jgi:hypothetical protein
MNNYVTSPEQNTQQHGSSNQASINNILHRPNPTTRTMPHEFTLDQGNQSAKRRKSGGSTYVNPPYQPDQPYMPQGSYSFVQPSSLYFNPIQSINQSMTVTSSRNNNNILRPQQQPLQPLGFVEALVCIKFILLNSLFKNFFKITNKNDKTYFVCDKIRVRDHNPIQIITFLIILISHRRHNPPIRLF